MRCGIDYGNLVLKMVTALRPRRVDETCMMRWCYDGKAILRSVKSAHSTTVFLVSTFNFPTPSKRPFSFQNQFEIAFTFGEYKKILKNKL